MRPMIAGQMAPANDLFVVCKKCGSEVSPYITECPYCGERLRKRAPKIERDEHGDGQPKVRRKAPKPTLPKMRSGEIPGIRADDDRRPYVTIVLLVLGALGALVLPFVAYADIAVTGSFHLADDAPFILTSPFLYANTWYQVACLVAIGVFGMLLERRHGPWVVALLWVLCAWGATFVASQADDLPFVLGANGAALGFLAAWALPVVLARRQGDPDDDDADLLGVLVIGIVVAAMPLAVDGASAVAGTVGGLAGLLVGAVLSRLSPRT